MIATITMELIGGNIIENEQIGIENPETGNTPILIAQILYISIINSRFQTYSFFLIPSLYILGIVIEKGIKIAGIAIEIENGMTLPQMGEP